MTHRHMPLPRYLQYMYGPIVEIASFLCLSTNIQSHQHKSHIQQHGNSLSAHTHLPSHTEKRPPAKKNNYMNIHTYETSSTSKLVYNIGTVQRNLENPIERPAKHIRKGHKTPLQRINAMQKNHI